MNSLVLSISDTPIWGGWDATGEKGDQWCIYVGETWANARDGKNKAWGEKDTTTGGTIGGVTFVVTPCFISLIKVLFQ